MRRVLSYTAYALGLLVIGVFVTNVMVDVGTKPFIYEHASDVPIAQAAVVPGAAILRNRELSPIFRNRADAAIQFYRDGKVLKILVSGGNSTVANNEVNPARNYLLENGIPEEDIFLDHAGFDTYSTMFRAREIFGVETMIISTQSFHLPRSIFVARALGIDAYGLRADVGDVLFRNYVREVFATEKALLDLLLNRHPKYLGDPVPILGEKQIYP